MFAQPIDVSALPSEDRWFDPPVGGTFCLELSKWKQGINGTTRKVLGNAWNVAAAETFLDEYEAMVRRHCASSWKTKVKDQFILQARSPEAKD